MLLVMLPVSPQKNFTDREAPTGLQELVRAFYGTLSCTNPRVSSPKRSRNTGKSAKGKRLSATNFQLLAVPASADKLWIRGMRKMAATYAPQQITGCRGQ